MSTAYPSIVRADFDANKATRTGRVQGLIDLHENVLRHPLMIYFAEKSTANHSWTDLESQEFFIPDYWCGRYLKVTLECKISGGTDPGYWRLVDADGGDAVISDEIDCDSTTYVGSGPATSIAIPDAWKDTVRTLCFQGYAPSGRTIYIRSISYVYAYVTD